MHARHLCAFRRTVTALLLAVSLGGCVYDPYYPAYGYRTYGYPTYGYPTYVGPPISIDLGFGYYSGHHHGHHGGHYGGHHGGHYGGHHGGHHGGGHGHRRH